MIDIIARGMIEGSNGDISQLSETVTTHTENDDIHVTMRDKENWNSHPNDAQASGNPVQIDGMQGGVPFSEMVVKGKNLLTYPYNETTKTVNGITFTDNGDGTITVNGTATANATFSLSSKIVYKSGVDYVISGCPNGGDRKFKIKGNSDGVNADDVGYGKTFSFSEDTECSVSILIYKDVTVENLIFRPQIELGTVATEYEPPITGRELTVNVCGKNLIPYPYYDGESKTLNGVTFTINADGSVTVDGTATANTNLWLYPYGKDYMHLNEDVSYFLSGNRCTSGEVIISLGFYNGSTWIKAENDEGNGKSFRISHSSNYDSICLSIFVEKNAVCDNITVYPQLELSDTATPYEPYHGSVTTITPTSNPYVIPNDIRQVEGLNNISVSEGELSVTGVRKNAAVKKIWDEIDEIKTAIIVSNGESE